MNDHPTTDSAAAPPQAATEPVRYGVVDMGSNGIRYQIVEIRDRETAPTVLEAHRAPVRLGQEVFLTGSIPEEAIAAAVDTFREFRDLCDRYGVRHIRAIGTSATREARNGDMLTERIARASGIEVEVISGSEEAALLTDAVRQRLDVTQGRMLLADLGGGSVEVIVLEDGDVVAAQSFQMGALKLLQALRADALSAEPTNPSFYELLDDYVSNIETRLEDLFGKKRRIERFVATGGNIETIADLMKGEGAGDVTGGCERYPLDGIEGWARKLSQMSHAERIDELGLRPDRADTILPAAVVYYRLGKIAGVDHVIVPRVGMRDGLLAQIQAGHLDRIRALDHEEMVLASCRSIAEKYQVHMGHAEQVRHLACALFDQTHELHELGAEDRVLLEAAALMHDIGLFVSNRRHHKHGHYLVREGDIVGLPRAERELVALVVRYHRKSHPQTRHEAYRALPREDRIRVSKLAALLRIADALDRDLRAKIDDVEVRVGDRRAELHVAVRSGEDEALTLERWALDLKARLFTEVFGLKVRLRTR